MDEFSKNIDLLASLGFMPAEPDDNYRIGARFQDIRTGGYITLSIGIIEDLIGLMKVIQVYNEYKTK
jgi:hypothetical protein